MLIVLTLVATPALAYTFTRPIHYSEVEFEESFHIHHVGAGHTLDYTEYDMDNITRIEVSYDTESIFVPDGHGAFYNTLTPASPISYDIDIRESIVQRPSVDTNLTVDVNTAETPDPIQLSTQGDWTDYEAIFNVDIVDGNLTITDGYNWGVWISHHFEMYSPLPAYHAVERMVNSVSSDGQNYVVLYREGLGSWAPLYSVEDIVSSIQLMVLLNPNEVPGYPEDPPTPETPMQPSHFITNWTDLHEIRDDLAGVYVLMNDLTPSTPGYDIYNSESGWLPIDDFVGEFYGEGYTIEGLRMDRTWGDNLGLFGGLGSSEVIIEDFTMRDFNITAGSLIDYVGAVAGQSSSASVHILRDIILEDGVVHAPGSDWVGGIIGSAWTTLLHQCHAYNVTVYGNNRVGGLVGNAWYSRIDRCSFEGDVIATEYQVGGVAGQYALSAMHNTSAYSNVEGTWWVGGLIGDLDLDHTDAIIEYCWSAGTVYASGNYAGGLVGLADGISGSDYIINCYSLSDVEGASVVGGFIGENNVNVSYSYSAGEVTSAGVVGGFIADNNGAVFESYWDTEASNQGSSDGGIGGTTSNMMDIDTFSAWDIEEVLSTDEPDTDYIWNIIVDGLSYPFLSEIPAAFTASGPPPGFTGIYSWTDLRSVADDLAGDYALMVDLDRYSEGYDTQMDGGWNRLGHFTGTFLGMGNTLSDMEFTSTVQALFRTLSTGAELHNLRFYNCTGMVGIVAHQSSQSTSIMTNVTFERCSLSHTSAINGVLPDTYPGTLENITFIDCLAESSGGHALLLPEITGTAENLMFINCTVTGAGGAYMFHIGSGGVVTQAGSVDVTVDGGTEAGGLFGYNVGTLSRGYALNATISATSAGGLGRTNSGTISDSYATSVITASSSAGGLLAQLTGGSVTNCFAVSEHTASGSDPITYEGGLIGHHTSGTITHSYYDSTVSGLSDTGSGEPQTTSEMMDIDTFSAWDIIAVLNIEARDTAYTWNIINGTSYPFLSWYIVVDEPDIPPPIPLESWLEMFETTFRAAYSYVVEIVYDGNVISSYQNLTEEGDYGYYEWLGATDTVRIISLFGVDNIATSIYTQYDYHYVSEMVVNVELWNLTSYMIDTGYFTLFTGENETLEFRNLHFHNLTDIILFSETHYIIEGNLTIEMFISSREVSVWSTALWGLLKMTDTWVLIGAILVTALMGLLTKSFIGPSLLFNIILFTSWLTGFTSHVMLVLSLIGVTSWFMFFGLSRTKRRTGDR